MLHGALAAMAGLEEAFLPGVSVWGRQALPTAVFIGSYVFTVHFKCVAHLIKYES